MSYQYSPSPIIALIIILICSSVIESHQDSQENVIYQNSEKYYKLISGGLGQIFWDEVLIHGRNFTELTISRDCSQNFEFLHDAYRKGLILPFEFIDSSARGTPATFFGTTSSFGDYDECLDIQSDDDDDDHNNFVGKYCTISFKTDNTSFGPEKTPVEEKLASAYPTANFYYPISGICIPSSCSKDDVQRILLSTFPKYNLQLLNVTNCDTKESTGFNYDNTTIQQKIAIYLITACLGAVVIGTLCELLGIEILRGSSLVSNLTELFAADKSSRLKTADIFKTGFSIYACAVHSIAAIVTPMGVYILNRQQDVASAVQTIWLQPLLNVTGLNIISFLGGLTLAISIYPNFKKRRSSYVKTIFNRWISTAPGIACLICMEFLFPIAGSGPMYTEIGQDAHDDCAKNWWKNILLIANWNPVLDNCANHTFWSSVDFQLFLLGLLAVFLFLKNTKLGISFCIFLGLMDFLITGYVNIKYDTVHALAAHPINVEKVVQYVDYIHNPTHNYMFTYSVGLLLGLFLVEGGSLNVGLPGIIMSFVFMQLGSYMTAIYNVYHFIPRSMMPLYFASSKIFWASSNSLAILYFTYTPPKDSKRPKKESVDSNNNPRDDQGAKGPQENEASLGNRLFLALSRLSTAIYLINYWYIRYDFFTARHPFEISTITFFKRFGYSVCFSTILAFFFHLLLLKPSLNFSKKLFSGYTKQKVD